MDLERVLARRASGRVTYAEVRATQGRLPGGYRHDRHVVDLGAGEAVTDGPFRVLSSGRRTAEHDDPVEGGQHSGLARRPYERNGAGDHPAAEEQHDDHRPDRPRRLARLTGKCRHRVKTDPLSPGGFEGGFEWSSQRWLAQDLMYSVRMLAGVAQLSVFRGR